tara:strand:- start:593 stop:1030 length:438 start_codon:yes stop_codon:yes gene_type:complete
MPKQYYTIRGFTSGMNNERSPRDLPEEQAVLIRNMSVDSPGIIKSGGSMYAHSASSIGGGMLPNSIYISKRGGSDLNKARLSGSGGYNLFYFESDHENSYTYSVTHQTVDSSAATDGEIKFTQPSTRSSSGFSDPASYVENTESG